MILAIDSSIINVPVVNKFVNIQMVSMEPELAPYGMVKFVNVMVVVTIVRSSSSSVVINFSVAEALGMTRMMMLMMVHKLWIVMVVRNKTFLLVRHKTFMVMVVWNIKTLVLVVFVARAVGRTAVITVMRTASSDGSLGRPHPNLLQPRDVTIIFVAHSRKHDTDGNKHDEDGDVAFHFKAMYALKKERFFKRADSAEMELKVSQKRLQELESAPPMFSVVDRVEFERLKRRGCPCKNTRKRRKYA